MSFSFVWTGVLHVSPGLIVVFCGPIQKFVAFVFLSGVNEILLC